MEISSKIISACIMLLAIFPSSESFENTGLKMRILAKQNAPDTLTLPSNATSIRENITDNFSCDELSYGYYADVDNDCQIFHVCLPVVFADGKNQTFKWSFICPEETVFDQGVFVCVREESSSIRCEESEQYYNLNDNFGGRDPEEDTSDMGGSNDGNTEDMTNDGAAAENSEDSKKRQKPQMSGMEMNKPEVQKKKNDRRKNKE